MSRSEWDDQPWWLQQAYLEGLEEEGVIESVRKESQTRDPNVVDAFDDDLALAAMGLKVVNA